MVFSNLIFLYVFLPIFFICYFLFNKNIVLCVFSFIFYAWGEPSYIFLLIISVFLNYIFGIKIEDSKDNKKTYLILAVAINLLILIIFKYANFLTGLIFTGINKNLVTNIKLPIGISFYTFQAISYIVDVYRGTTLAQRKFRNLFLYISMFPQLIAGPIVRYKTIEKEILDRRIDIDSILYGIYRFTFGLGKKVIIANQLSLVVDKLLNGNLYEMSKVGLIIGVIVFILQLYFDFSGYSDMAIGLGSIIGFHFEENFNFPFASNSMTEFWRRWHMSLGSFFRDYVYIPLGGNRKNQVRNILVVWFLTGVWHGASLNFVLWGGFLAVFIVIEKYVLKDILEKIPIVLNKIYFVLITYLSFSIFYFDDVRRLKEYFISILSNGNIIDLYTRNTILNNIFLIIIAIFFALPVSTKINDLLGKIIKYKTPLTIVRLCIFLVIIIYSTILLVGNTSNPFLYFRF